MQEHHLENFLEHYFGDLSPWSAHYVIQFDELKTAEEQVFHNFDNRYASPENIGYGENFRAYTNAWIENISNNIDFANLGKQGYQAENRAIAIDNLSARALPTDDPHFYSYKLPGQGYPFDNLQVSAVWAGTPLYILAQSKDQRWSLVITPEFAAWVKSKGLARVNEHFIQTWTQAAKKNLIAITASDISLLDEKQHYLFQGYVGAVFPGQISKEGFKLMLPARDNKQQAMIQSGFLSAKFGVRMPWVATPAHFADLIKTLIGRPYGWGGLYFYNDCSAELKSLLTPFGIWLPRHSSDQVYAGKLVDLSTSTPQERLTYLREHGREFLTLVYIGGHVFLYLGNYPNPDNPQQNWVLSYQNKWGLTPHPPTGRAVFGQAVLFPLLLEYPEDPHLASDLSGSYFQVSFLDELPNYRLKFEMLDIKALINH